MTTGYLSVEQVRALHADQLRLYGGATGLRDKGGLESALARPAMTFAGEDLYEDLASKAAALMHSLVLNHAFVDGNKRCRSPCRDPVRRAQRPDVSRDAR